MYPCGRGGERTTSRRRLSFDSRRRTRLIRSLTGKRKVKTVTTPTQRLFTPVQVGPFTLTHRVVMAPLTRSRSEQPGDIPGDLMLGSRVVWCAGNVCRRAGRRLEQDHKRDAREGWPHVLATLACGPLVARLDDQQSSPVAPSIEPQDWLASTSSIATPHGWQKPSPHRTLDISAIPGMVEDYRQAARKGENSHARRSETRQQVSRHCAAEPRQRDGNTVKPGSRIPDRAGIFSRLLLTERSSSVDELRRAPSTGIDCQLLQTGHSLS